VFTLAKSVREVMAKDPQTVSRDATIAEAARLMREHEIGDVIVLDGQNVTGILTDRDIVVRAIAEGRDTERETVVDVCSKNLTTISPDDTVDRAVELMRDNAIRRLPVVEAGLPVGIVSLGDLAEEKDPRSALADISRAPANA
jgi:CBS domain-containing protein